MMSSRLCAPRSTSSVESPVAVDVQVAEPLGDAALRDVQALARGDEMAARSDVELAVDAVELDVRVVVGLDRDREARRRGCCELGHDRLRLGLLRPGCRGPRRPSRQQAKAPRRSPRGRRFSASIRLSSPRLRPCFDSEQTRRWRSGPSQVADTSTVSGRLQPRTAAEISAKRHIPSSCVRVARSWSGEHDGGAVFRCGPGLASRGSASCPRAARSRPPTSSAWTLSRTHLPGRTASGLPVGKGIVAVDPKVIPLGTRTLRPRLRHGHRRGRRTGDQGPHHRPLDADHGRGPPLGPADGRHHDLPVDVGSVRDKATAMIRAGLAVVAAALAAAALAGSATPGTGPRLRSSRPPSSERSPRPASPRAAPGRSRSTCGPARSCSRRTPPRALAPASAEKLAVSFAALRVLGPGLPLPHRGRRRRRARRQDVEGRPLPRRLRRPDARVEDLEALARDVKRVGHQARDRPHRRRRAPLRLAARRTGLEAVVPRRRVASALGARRRRRRRPGRERVRDRGHEGVRGRARAPRDRGRGRKVTGRAPAEVFPLALDLSEPLSAIVRHMNRESDNFVSEMLLKELGATRRAARLDRRRRRGRPRRSARGGRAGVRRADRRRLGPLAARPPDREVARRDPPRRRRRPADRGTRSSRRSPSPVCQGR